MVEGHVWSREVSVINFRDTKNRWWSYRSFPNICFFDFSSTELITYSLHIYKLELGWSYGFFLQLWRRKRVEFIEWECHYKSYCCYFSKEIRSLPKMRNRGFILCYASAVEVVFNVCQRRSSSRQSHAINLSDEVQKCCPLSSLHVSSRSLYKPRQILVFREKIAPSGVSITNVTNLAQMPQILQRFTNDTYVYPIRDLT